MKDNKSDDNYRVGYGKPPLHTQFRRGRSGNPTGRPRGSKNSITLFRQELDKKVQVREGGRLSRITKHQAIITQLVNKALGGNYRAIELLLTKFPELQRAEPRKPGGLSNEVAARIREALMGGDYQPRLLRMKRS